MTSTAGDNPGTQNQLGFYFVRNGASLAQQSIHEPKRYPGQYKLVGIPMPAGLICLPWNASTGKRFVSKYPEPVSPYLDYAPVIRYSEVVEPGGRVGPYAAGGGGTLQRWPR